jgi:hypothetical protein
MTASLLFICVFPFLFYAGLSGLAILLAWRIDGLRPWKTLFAVMVFWAILLGGLFEGQSDADISESDPATLQLTDPQRHLSENQIEVLEALTEGDYLVRGQAYSIGSKERYIVIIGESHIKSVHDRDLGINALKAFKTIGVEAPESHLTARSILVDAAFELYWLPAIPFMIFDSDVETSTIFAAERRAEFIAHGAEILTNKKDQPERVVDLSLVEDKRVVRQLESMDILSADEKRRVDEASDYTIDARNKIMAANIKYHFRLTQKDDILVVVCGMAHVRGILQELLQP